MSWKTNGQTWFYGASHTAKRTDLGKRNDFNCLCHSCEERKEPGECILTGNRPGKGPTTGWVCERCRVEEEAARTETSQAPPDLDGVGDEDD